jgi:hypothetical protein
LHCLAFQLHVGCLLHCFRFCKPWGSGSSELLSIFLAALLSTLGLTFLNWVIMRYVDFILLQFVSVLWLNIFSITEKFMGFNAAQACYDIYIIQSTVFVASSIIICISLWYEFTVEMSWTDFRFTWCKVLGCHQPLILAWRLIDLAFLWYTPLGDMNSRKSQFYVSLNALRIGSDANCREVKSVNTQTLIYRVEMNAGILILILGTELPHSTHTNCGPHSLHHGCHTT